MPLPLFSLDNNPEQSGLAERRIRHIFGDEFFGQESLFTWKQFEALIGPLNSIDQALDIGCGTGAYTLRLARSVKGSVVGIDKNFSKLTIARQRAKDEETNSNHAKFVCSSFDSLPLSPRKSLNLIYSIDALQHSVDVSTAIASLQRYLQDDGKFAGTIWCFERSISQLAAAWGATRCYPEREVVEIFQRIQHAEISIGRTATFPTHCDASLQSWVDMADELTETIGRRAFEERLALERSTVEAVRAGALCQLQFSISRRA